MATLFRSSQIGIQGTVSPKEYDPNKPHNEGVRSLIRKTHNIHDNPLIISAHGKRFEITENPLFIRHHTRQQASDGIGTKGLLHYVMDTEHRGAKDAFFMVMDDLIEGGYIPVSFTDHIQIQEENQEKIFRIVNALVRLAIDNSMCITGGETAIINTLQGFEIGIVADGYVKKGHRIDPSVRKGDGIIGIESSGMHSNGYSFVRDILLPRFGNDLDVRAPWSHDESLGEQLTIPTRGYLPAIKKLLHEFTPNVMPACHHIHGMVHITGGGLSKLTELIKGRDDVDIEISRAHALNPQGIYVYMQKEFGISSEAMYKRFNNGIGYVIAVQDDKVDNALHIIRRYYPAERIGYVTAGTGKVIVESKYDSEILTFT